MKKLIMLMTAAILVIAMLMPASVLGAGPVPKYVENGDTICQDNVDAPYIEGKNEWHWVINKLDPTTAAPSKIVAHFETAGDVDVLLEKVTGGVAHYTLADYLDDELVYPYACAEANNGSFSYNRFNLSHRPDGNGGNGGGPKATLTVGKYYDSNANGKHDPGERLLEGWKINVAGVDNVTTYSASVNVGTYGIFEYMPCEPNWVFSGANVTGTSTYTIDDGFVSVTLAKDNVVTVMFGNYCQKPSGGKTIGFWSNRNGQALITSGNLTALRDLNLVSKNGNPFNPTTAAQVRDWLLKADAVNMAYMLSAQLAAMKLNVLSGFVDGNAFYVPYGGTIDALMTEANNALGLDGNTPSGDSNRSSQEKLKCWLDELNNGASVIPSNPCDFTFDCD